MRAVALVFATLFVGTACDDGGTASITDAAPTPDAACTEGTIGCACVDEACSDGSNCTDGLCEAPPDTCPPGTEGCPCDGALCVPPLACVADVCQAPVQSGATGEACVDNRCQAGNRCDDDVCVPCRAGSQSCNCDAGACNEGLACADDQCVSAASTATGTCSTPCTQGVELEDGSFTPCPDDGLLDGCFGSTECTDGQCLVAGDALRTCTTDGDCPDFQACLPAVGGGDLCASNCATDQHCVGGATCHRRACRIGCDLNDAATACPEETFCDAIDGDTGYCMPSGASAELGAAEPAVLYAIDETVLDLSTTDRAEFTLTNTGQSQTEFTVLTTEHVTPDETVLLAASGDDPLAVEDCADACPLPWITLSSEAGAVDGHRLTVTLDAGASATITLQASSGATPAAWRGALEVHQPDSNTTRIQLTYAQSPPGTWSGSVYYFGDFKADGIDAWMADRSADEGVRNALVRYFAQYRAGAVSWAELSAALVSSRDETWRSNAIASVCAVGNVCFPYDNRQGYLVFSNNPDIEVPSGAVELPFSINLRADDADPSRLLGRINSDVTLQYLGDPTIELQFEGNPGDCPAEGCSTQLSALSAETLVGGRYRGDGGCATGFERVSTPWLLPGLAGRSRLDATTGGRVIDDCRDLRGPTADEDSNLNLARANPIPDGLQRRRVLELVDGFIRNRDTLVVLFRERTSAVGVEGDGGDDLVSYGYMMLKRIETDLDPTLTVGQVPEATPGERQLAEVACSDDLLREMGSSRGALEAAFTAGDADTLDAVAAVLVGLPADGGGRLPEVDWPLVVHAYCEDTGFFDGGPNDDGSDHALPTACPEGSRVTWFVLDTDVIAGAGTAAAHQAWLSDNACHLLGDDDRGRCGETLEAWLRDGTYGISTDVFWRCADDGHPSTCDSIRYDLRAGKTFFSNVDLPLPPFRSDVSDAFRYRTRFANRDGQSVGFAPSICEGTGDGISYCYDPTAIEQQAVRADCVIEVYTRFASAMTEGSREALRGYLEEHFGYVEHTDALNRSVTVRGYEPLYAELLIMLGDEAYTSALTSRFDLAGAGASSFAGDQFERDGIRLAGIPGAEMANLHIAVQNYQLVLERFYTLFGALSGDIAQAAAPNATPSFVTTRTLTTYVDRLIRASTQKAKVQSAIATRYQGFNRADLAKAVVERAYTEAYLESGLLMHLMNTLIEVSERADRDQIRGQIRTAQISYRAALSGMREVQEQLETELTTFGYAPEYVPFPALELGRDNPFEVSLQRARDRISIASQAETLAIESNRAFNTDLASFENELTGIENTYEQQLLDVCGAFEVDGVIYPAVARYADLSQETLLLGDPCGQMGTGEIYDATLDIKAKEADLQRVRVSMQNTIREARIEEQRVAAACENIQSFADVQYQYQGEINDLEGDLLELEQDLAQIDRAVAQAQAISGSINVFGAVAGTVAYGAGEAGHHVLEADVRDKRDRVNRLQQDLAREQQLNQCDLLQIDGEAAVKRILLQSAVQRLEAAAAKVAYSQATAQLKQLVLRAKRLEQELEEMLELAINVEVARNDPNVRIYRSDSVLVADYTFESAIRAAYVATRVLSYYTSQSYAGLDELFLVRMIERGDHNLQAYIIELEDAFRDFDGLPDTRVLRISLKDEIFGVPLLDTEGRALTTDDRNASFVERLTDRTLLNEDGYVVVPFHTRADMLSPLTRNHQIKYVSAQLVGSNLGDIFSRVYLRMAGTGSVAPLGADDTAQHYLFAERVAVIDAFMSEKRSSLLDDDEVYRSRSLASRPVLNTQWELVLNMVDEPANADFRLEDLTDVRLYFYYTDFVEF